MELNELAGQAHATAVNSGFYDTKLSDAHCKCLIISELMEAVEADRKNRHANVEKFYKNISQNDEYSFKDKLVLQSFKDNIKDTVEDELADTCIRLLDFAGYRDLTLFDMDMTMTLKDFNGLNFTEIVYILVRLIISNKLDNVNFVLNLIIAYSEANKIRLDWHIKNKMEYNLQRSYKHGKKY